LKKYFVLIKKYKRFVLICISVFSCTARHHPDRDTLLQHVEEADAINMTFVRKDGDSWLTEIPAWTKSASPQKPTGQEKPIKTGNRKAFVQFVDSDRKHIFIGFDDEEHFSTQVNVRKSWINVWKIYIFFSIF